MPFPLRPQNGESYGQWLIKALAAVATAGLIAKLYATYGPGPVLFSFVVLFLLVIVVLVLKPFISRRRAEDNRERLEW